MGRSTQWLLAFLLYACAFDWLSTFHYHIFNALIPNLPNNGLGRGDWPKSCTRPDQYASENATRSGLKVIVPSMSICGTTSIIDALKSVGVKAYHVEESMVYIAEILWDNQTHETFARSLSRCQVEALSLEPFLDSFPAVLASAGPDVKVVHAWRDFHSWSKSAGPGAASMKENRWNMICHFFEDGWSFLPWVPAVEALTGVFSLVKRDGATYDYKKWPVWKAVLSYAVQKVQRRYDAPETKLMTRGPFRTAYFHGMFAYENAHEPLVKSPGANMEEIYLNWHDEIRRLTPPGKLLEFDVKKHGYKELYEFLKDEYPQLKEMVGKKLPKTRSKDSFSNDNLMIEYPKICICSFALLGTMHIVNIFLVERTYVRFALALLGLATSWRRAGKEKAS